MQIVRHALLALLLVSAYGAELIPLRAPDGDLQPQALVGSDGTIHLLSYGGAESGGDLHYRSRSPGAVAWSAPVTVNSVPGSALAIGTIRGAHLALGRAGWVHVAWMGSSMAVPTGPGGSAPMLYARKAAGAEAFAPQRNLLTWAVGLDGGGSIAADGAGRVRVAWHAGPAAGGDAGRSVFVATSTDDGASFARETDALARAVGACGCCGMRAASDAAGGLHLLFRAATGGTRRDMMLAYAADPAEAAVPILLEPWSLDTCPMSTAAMARARDGMLVAWQGPAGLSWSRVTAGRVGPRVRLPAGAEAKHPALVEAEDGTIAVAWTEGTGWKRGGSLHWQLYDAVGRPLGAPGAHDGVPPWSIPTVVATGAGRFEAWY